jgi:hypothetical protein
MNHHAWLVLMFFSGHRDEMESHPPLPWTCLNRDIQELTMKEHDLYNDQGDEILK